MVLLTDKKLAGPLGSLQSPATRLPTNWFLQ